MSERIEVIQQEISGLGKLTESVRFAVQEMQDTMEAAQRANAELEQAMVMISETLKESGNES